MKHLLIFLYYNHFATDKTNDKRIKLDKAFKIAVFKLIINKLSVV